MVQKVSDKIDWPKHRRLRLRVTFSDNSSSVELNGATLMSFDARAIDIDQSIRLDPLLKLGRNILLFRGANDASAPSNPNPWRFDLALQDSEAGVWDDYKTYNAWSPGYPGGSPPLGPSYELTIEINVS